MESLGLLDLSGLLGLFGLVGLAGLVKLVGLLASTIVLERGGYQSTFVHERHPKPAPVRVFFEDSSGFDGLWSSFFVCEYFGVGSAILEFSQEIGISDL